MIAHAPDRFAGTKPLAQWPEAPAAMRFARPGWIDLAVFLMLFSGPPRLRVRDATASLRGETDAAVLLRLFVWAAGLIWILYRLYPFLVSRGIVPRMSLPQILGIVLSLVLAAGVFVAPGPGLTAFAVYQLVVMVVFSWLYVQLYGPDAYVRQLFWGCLLLTIAILCAWAFMPELVVRRGRVRGDLIGPSGALAAMGLTLCLTGTVRLRRWVFLSASVLFAVLLIAAQTRTAFGGFILAALLGLLFRYAGPIRKFYAFAAIATLVAALFGLLEAGGEYAIREEQSLATMSDRIPLWSHLIGTMMRESPAIGLGYYSASRVLGPQYNENLGNAHSAFVEILVGGGLVGGLLFFALYAVLIAYSARLLLFGRSSSLVFAVLGLFLITFVMSVTNTEGVQGGPIGFTFWSMCALIPATWEKLMREGLWEPTVAGSNGVGPERRWISAAPV